MTVMEKEKDHHMSTIMRMMPESGMKIERLLHNRPCLTEVLGSIDLPDMANWIIIDFKLHMR
jgi:hypothetical protein